VRLKWQALEAGDSLHTEPVEFKNEWSYPLHYMPSLRVEGQMTACLRADI
jgi:hypothetical protein